MKILIEEEYGFKYWLWTVDRPFDELYSILKNKIDETFYSGIPGLPVQFNFGKWEEIKWEEYKEYTIGDKQAEADAYAHFHNDFDSWIEEADGRGQRCASRGRFIDGDK